MKKLLFSILLLCAVTTLSAKVKVVDSSSKSAPEWYGATINEFIIVTSSSATSLDDAKQSAMEQVKIKMIESVAQNINFTSFHKIEEKLGDSSSYSDEFKSALLLNTAKIPFINGISESKIEAYYWSITEDKAISKRNYEYSIKYPLPSDMIESYIAEFKRIDAEMAQEFEMLDSGYYSVMSVDEIGEAIIKCGELEAYFFDSTRKKAVASLKVKYSSLYSRITVVTQTEELGYAHIALQIGDREIAATQQPVARYDREMIQDLKIVPQSGGFDVIYDPQFCRDDIPYVITLNITVGNRKINHELTFTKSSKSKLRIQPQGSITLTAQDIKAESITNVQFQFDLIVDGLPKDTNVTVGVVTLRVPNLKDEIYCNSVSVKRVADNRVTLVGLSPLTIATSGDSSTSTIKLLSGEITGYYGSSKTPFQSKFSRSYLCNW